MTESEFVEIARKQYASIIALQKKDNFYDYEKEFEGIIVEMGKEVLEKSLVTLPNDKRKKKYKNQIWLNNYVKFTSFYAP
jgi:hypothetical protein